jgi:large subunit ribosomal protein L6
MKLQEVTIPSGVEICVQSRQIKVKGSLGTLYIKVNKTFDETWSMAQSLLNNAIVGVNQGYLQKLQIYGSGYRVTDIKENSIVLKLGYSYDTEINIPFGIMVQANKYNQILCVGIDKQKLSQFTRNLQKARPYNIYKKKGIYPIGSILPAKVSGKPGIFYV